MKNDWYVAILKFGNFHYPFFAPGSYFYRNLKDNLDRSNRYDPLNREKLLISIEAEIFNVSEKAINKISQQGLVRKIADRFDERKEFNAQEELEKICKI